MPLGGRAAVLDWLSMLVSPSNGAWQGVKAARQEELEGHARTEQREGCGRWGDTRGELDEQRLAHLGQRRKGSNGSKLKIIVYL